MELSNPEHYNFSFFFLLVVELKRIYILRILLLLNRFKYKGECDWLKHRFTSVVTFYHYLYTSIFEIHSTFIQTEQVTT